MNQVTANYNDVEIHDIKHYDGGIIIEWDSQSLGFGSVDLYKIKGESGEFDWNIGTECMSKEFVQALFMKMIDFCKLQ